MPNSSLATWLPWTDRAGRLSWLKLIVFVATLVPAVWMTFEWQQGLFSAKPLTDTIRESGDWALRFLVASLAVTPLRFVTRWNRLILVRRMLGLAALAYTLVHVALYCVDLQLDVATILSEIVLRTYLTVGTVATIGLVVLGLTSNDFSIRELGAVRWNWLHGSVYAMAALSLLHEFMEVKIDSYEVAILSGIFVLQMGVRRLRKAGFSLGFVHLVGLAVLAGLATALMEAGYYAFSTGVDARRVLAANLDFSYTIRPAWWVLATGICLAVVSLLSNVLLKRPKAAGKSAQRVSAAPAAYSSEPRI